MSNGEEDRRQTRQVYPRPILVRRKPLTLMDHLVPFKLMPNK